MIALQSLFFQLRTIREDLLGNKRQHLAAAQKAAVARAAAESAAGAEFNGVPGADQATQNGAGAPNFAAGMHPNAANGVRHPWEHVDEIMAILKTAFPLLALSMEMIVDQIATRFKPSPDEDIYRLISALLTDAIQVSLLSPSLWCHAQSTPLLSNTLDAQLSRMTMVCSPPQQQEILDALPRICILPLSRYVTSTARNFNH